MSKSITLKTHKFLTALGLHPVGGALKEDQMQINAAAMRKSVRKFLRNFRGDADYTVGGFRMRSAVTLWSACGRSFTVYDASGRKMGWLTFVHVPKSQVVNVYLNNEF